MMTELAPSDSAVLPPSILAVSKHFGAKAWDEAYDAAGFDYARIAAINSWMPTP
jgi:hypothetical protein